MKKITTVAPFILLLGLSSSSFALTSTRSDVFIVTTTSMAQTNFAIIGEPTTGQHSHARILQPNTSMLTLAASRSTQAGKAAIVKIKYADQTNPSNYCDLMITDTVREDDSGWWFGSSTKSMPIVNPTCYGNLVYSTIQKNDDSSLGFYDAAYTISFNYNAPTAVVSSPNGDTSSS